MEVLVGTSFQTYMNNFLEHLKYMFKFKLFLIAKAVLVQYGKIRKYR